MVPEKRERDYEKKAADLAKSSTHHYHDNLCVGIVDYWVRVCCRGKFRSEFAYILCMQIRDWSCDPVCGQSNINLGAEA